MTDAMLMNRAKVRRPICCSPFLSTDVTDSSPHTPGQAILFIGAILKAVQPEEGDDERRELERLVAEANARRKEKKHKKDAATGAKDKKVHHHAAAAAGGGPSAAAAGAAGSSTPDVKA